MRRLARWAAHRARGGINATWDEAPLPAARVEEVDRTAVGKAAAFKTKRGEGLLPRRLRLQPLICTAAWPAQGAYLRVLR